MDSRLRTWTVAFAEGFSTLAVEVIVIRLAIPVTGSSMTLTGVMLGVVLFALSAGYWHGGVLSSRWDKARTRRALTRNLLIAGVVYAVVSFPAEVWLLGKALDLGLGLGLAIGVVGTLLFGLPVYLVAQTVPLLAELTNEEGKAGKASGKVLFYSTLGSVAGGIVTPIVLFPYFGVRVSSYLVAGLLFAAALLMAGGVASRGKIAVAGAAVLGAMLVGPMVGRPAGERYSFDSPHQTIRVVEQKNDQGRMERVMLLNGGRASGLFVDTGESSFAYVREADRALAGSGSAEVLTVGAAGFTFPRDACALPGVRRVDAVDVDAAVWGIAEREFLRAKIPERVRFFPLSARFALRRFRREGARYGFTLLDAYSGMGIPDELLTAEFLEDVRAVSERVAANVILDRDAESAFCRNTMATFRRVFGRVWMKDVDEGDSFYTNYLVTNWALAGAVEWTGAGEVYTDDRNTANRDHVNLLWSD